MAGDKIEVTISMIDDITNKLNDIEQNTGSMSGSFMKAQVALGAAKMAMSAVASAAGMLSDAIQQGVGAAADFEFQMHKIANVGDLTAPEMDQLGGTIKDMAIGSMFSIEQMQTAFYELAAAGSYTAEEMQTVMDAATTLATATGTDLASATDTTVKIMNAFGLSADESAGLADTLTQAANMSALELSDLGAALKYTGSTAVSAGMDIQEVSGILAIMSNAGLDASMAGRGLRGAMLEMASPTKEAQKAMRNLGVEFFDSEGNMRKMTDIVPEMASAMSELTTQQKLQNSELIFGKMAGSAMLTLMNQEIDSSGNLTGALGEMTDAMYDQGVAQAQSEILMDTTKFKMDELKGMLEATVMGFGDAIIGTEAFGEALGMMKEFLADPAITETLAIIGQLVGEVLVAVMPMLMDVILALLPTIKMLAGFLGDLLPIIQPLIDFVGTFLMKAFEVLGPVLERLLPVLLELAEVLVAALMPVLEAFLPVIDMIGPIFDTMIPIIKSLIPIIVSLTPVIKMIAELFAHNLIVQIKALIVVWNLLAPIITLISHIFEFLAPAIKLVTNLLTPLLKAVQLLMNPFVVLGAAIEVVQHLIQGIVDTMANVGSGILDFITFWDPPGPCLAEAIDMSRESLAAMKDELHGLPNAIDISGPSISKMTDDFAGAGASPTTETIAKSFMGGVAGEEKTVNITIQGDVKDEETIDRIADAVTDDRDIGISLSGYYGPI